jgi:hypothetical protein
VVSSDRTRYEGFAQVECCIDTNKIDWNCTGKKPISLVLAKDYIHLISGLTPKQRMKLETLELTEDV